VDKINKTMSKKVEPNYFYVNRALLSSDRWLSESFTRGQAWVDLFGLAQHTKGFFRVRGIKVEVDRGQLGYSQVTLAKRWKWSRNKVRRYLKELELSGDISLKTKHQNCDITTIITLLKYDKWQGDETPNGTPEGHQKDTKRNTYKNDNNDKNEKKENMSANADETFKRFWESYPKKELKKKSFDIWKSKNLSDKVDLIISFIEKAKETERWRGGFVKQPTTFLNNECWNDSLDSYNNIQQSAKIIKI